MVKRAPKKTPLPSAHSDASEDSDSSPNSSADFQMLMSALQGKFAKKAKDQQVRFEGEMKKIVAKTVEALSEKVAAAAQLGSLEQELATITKEREDQVAEFQGKYKSMKKSIEDLLKKLEKLDEDYSQKVKLFFETMNSYRDKAKPSHETIEQLAQAAQKSIITTHASKKQRR